MVMNYTIQERSYMRYPRVPQMYKLLKSGMHKKDGSIDDKMCS
jgi:hypothetical protein